MMVVQYNAIPTKIKVLHEQSLIFKFILYSHYGLIVIGLQQTNK
jgi:hypothetical protein